MKVAGNGKLQLHLGATLQPSYLLNTDAYVLSNDYSSYIKGSVSFQKMEPDMQALKYIFLMRRQDSLGNWSPGEVSDFLHL